jgi:hypothetical protein
MWSAKTAAKCNPVDPAGLTLRLRNWFSQKILLDEIDAAMAQDIVGRRHVKKELRQTESQQQRLTGKISLRPVPKGEDRLFFFGSAVNLSGLL